MINFKELTIKTLFSSVGVGLWEPEGPCLLLSLNEKIIPKYKTYKKWTIKRVLTILKFEVVYYLYY